MDTQANELVTFYTDRNPTDWFMSPDGFDETLRTKYGSLVTKARASELDYLAGTPKGVLALIILLDQIPRNIFRGKPESFSSDLKAQDIATRAIAQGLTEKTKDLTVYQQYLLLMPLMHAEDLTSQIACKALIKNMMLDAPENSEEREFFQRGLDFTQRHLECVAQLGRFPKRNEAIGRQTTEEEHEFLKKNPGGF